MPDGPGTGGKQGDLVARLRAVIGAKDEQITALTASLEAALAALEGERELRVAELERRLSMDSTDPGTPSSKVSYGPALNAAAVLLSCHGNVPAERAWQVIAMLLGMKVSAGWVDKAAARVSAQLQAAGFDDAMTAALTAEDALAADETPVNVLDQTAPQPAPGETRDSDPREKDGKDAAGAPPTASPHSTPSAARSKANPGYPHGPPPADSNSRHP